MCLLIVMCTFFFWIPINYLTFNFHFFHTRFAYWLLSFLGGWNGRILLFWALDPIFVYLKKICLPTLLGNLNKPVDENEELCILKEWKFNMQYAYNINITYVNCKCKENQKPSPQRHKVTKEHIEKQNQFFLKTAKSAKFLTSEAYGLPQAVVTCQISSR